MLIWYAMVFPPLSPGVDGWIDRQGQDSKGS